MCSSVLQEDVNPYKELKCVQRETVSLFTYYN